MLEGLGLACEGFEFRVLGCRGGVAGVLGRRIQGLGVSSFRVKRHPD